MRFAADSDRFVLVGAQTGKIVNIKKGVPLPVMLTDKVVEAGNERIFDRNYTVIQDFVGGLSWYSFEMKSFGHPWILDVAHSVAATQSNQWRTDGRPN